MQLHLPKTAQKLFPHGAKGIVPTSMVYIGADKVASFLDSLVGSPTQRIGIPLPLLGSINVKDIIVYLGVNGGAKPRIDTIIAFFVNKFLNTGIGAATSIKSITNPVVSVPGPINTTQGAPI